MIWTTAGGFDKQCGGPKLIVGPFGTLFLALKGTLVDAHGGVTDAVFEKGGY